MEKLAFETKEYRGYRIKAFYLEEGNRDAKIELWNDKDLVKSTTAPAYRIWNYHAHAMDIIDEHIMPGTVA